MWAENEVLVCEDGIYNKHKPFTRLKQNDYYIYHLLSYSESLNSADKV
jgi:hypothetical protein